MAKKAPEHHDVLDDPSLDEYGVWVKAGPDDSSGLVDDSVADLLDDNPAANTAEAENDGLVPLLDEGMDIFESRAGVTPVVGMNQKEQEVPEMSENDKTNAASPSDDLDIDNEISLATSDDQLTGDDDDLGGLSDLLLNIDEEQDSEDTIYLEDDDLSLDLDDTEELGMDSDMSLGRDDDGYDEDISIPGLDDLNMENDDIGLAGFEDALAQLDEESIDIPSEDSGPPASAGPNDSLPSLEMHDIEEVGLDEFLQDSNQDTAGIESFDEFVIEEEPFEPVPGLSVTSSENSDESLVLDDPFDLQEELGADEEIIMDDTSLDLDENISLEPSSFEPELSAGGSGESYEFDDVAALTDDLIDSKPSPSPTENSTPYSTQESSTTVLKSIEEELHAIRNELTDLRSELKKLRGKGASKDSSESLDVTIDTSVAAVDSLQVTAESETSFEPEMTAEEKAVAGGGFFDDDEDETIALTGDELDNILNSAEFTEEVGESSSPDLDDLDIDQPFEIAADTVDMSTAEDDKSGFEQSIDEESDLVFEDLGEQDDFSPIEEINLHEIDGLAAGTEENLDEAVVDLTSNYDAASEDAVTAAEIVEDPFGGSEQAVEQLAAMDIDNVLAGIEELKDNEEDIELFTGEELDSIELEIPDSAKVSKPVNAVKPLPNGSLEQGPADVSGGLKQEIKAVLAYMDQLLESLPEDKIEEFARSEHFEVYKKLFTELGL